ncbi:MAG: hypothetical protein WCF22_04790 [Candidatus Sulfotelmatobacter sp.]
MRKTSAVSALLFLAVGMFGCNAAKQAGSTAPTNTNIPNGAWVLAIDDFIGGRDTVTVQVVYPNGTTVYDVSPVGVISCANGGITYDPGDGPQPAGNPVVGPACFVALGGGCNGGCVSGTTGLPPNITSSNGNGTSGDLPLTFSIGVPTNPAPNGSTFNIQYGEFHTTIGTWQMDGTGTISNGVVSGTWVCDPSTPDCAGLTGTFTATQQ